VKLYRTARGPLIETDKGRCLLEGVSWNALVNRRGLRAALATELAAHRLDDAAPPAGELLAPIENAEVWAAGVTYYRSRDARIEESKDTGGGDFYARVYNAERPELFFKAMPHRVAAPGAPIRIRRDSKWSVPEPELALWISVHGTIEGYTIGNDVSSRDIEGENPLYLPQAKVYDGSCALGPCLLVPNEPLAKDTTITLEIARDGAVAFRGRTSLAQLKRSPEELRSWLFREQTFPNGCFLLTGTGIVPEGDFTLAAGDLVGIEIDGIGRLVNPVG
jgi:2-dehydro-3-deoxy-D-arabinonate dehydratase